MVPTNFGPVPGECQPTWRVPPGTIACAGGHGDACLPSQNVRLGAQFNIFTRYLGATSNSDGAGRNPGDNNTTYLYAWLAC